MEADRSTDSLTTTFNILFVCTGNTCRSPMAEVLAREELSRRGWRNVQVASAGTAASWGESATPQAVSVARRRGLELALHCAQPLNRELVDWADLILAMSPSHLGVIAHLGGEHKMALLGDFAAGEEGASLPVPDPFGAEESVYEDTFRELRGLVRHSLDRLAPILNP